MCWSWLSGVRVVGGGFVGVDVFFVLSGFLITGLLVDEIARTGSISIGDYYARRVRAPPLSTLVLAATAVATTSHPSTARASPVTSSGAAVWGLGDWKFAAGEPQYMADTDKSPVLHYWSLAVEQFYVVWPLLLLPGRDFCATGVARGDPSDLARAGRRHRRVVRDVVAADGHAGPLGVLRAAHARRSSGSARALALLRPMLPLMTRRAAQGAAVLGAAMVVGAAVVMDEATPFPGTAALVPVLGTAPAVAAGARLPDGVVARTLSRPGPRYVGRRISYAWYLWH